MDINFQVPLRGSVVERLGQPLGADERGLVISPPFRLLGPTGVSVGGVLDPAMLRMALLFWDKLDCPVNSSFHIGVGQDAQALEDLGILSRTKVQAYGMMTGAQPLIIAQRETFRFLDEKEPGRWSLGRTDASDSAVVPDLEAGRGVLLRLFGAMPVPKQDVAFEDILEFKTRRRDELIALRHHLERLYQSIRAAEDPEQALVTELEALDLAVSDHFKAVSEAGFGFYLSSLDVKLNYLESIKTGAGAAGIAFAAQLPLAGVLTAAVAGAASGVSIEQSVGLRHRHSAKGPFEYVARMRGELPYS